MDAELEAALIAVAGAMRPAIDPWWIIGSAAVVLLGGDTGVADVDLLTSERDAAALVARLGIPVSPPDVDPRFRSRLFARWQRPDRDVEIMGGLMLAAEAGWSELAPTTRVAAGIGGETVYTSGRDEMIAILARFGRDKDHARARILARCTGAPG
jgi:hypothetical protein